MPSSGADGPATAADLPEPPPASRLRRALAVAHERTAWLYSGYTRADLAVGLQIMLGWAVLLGLMAPTVVWNWLDARGASATLMLVLYGLCVQPVMGMTLLALPVAVLNAALSSALGFIPTYLAYAANGGSYEGGSAAKGATLVAAGSVIAALLAVPRMRLGQAALLFYICTFLLSVRLFATYWVYTPNGAFAVPKPPNSLAYYIFLDISIPAAVALPVVWLAMPAPAGRKARGVFCRVLRGLGQLGSGVGVGMLLLVSRVEIDLYQKPRRLNAKAYKQAAAAAEDADTCLAIMLEALSGNRAKPFDLSLCRQLAPQLRGLQAALAGCCEALAATVEGRLLFGEALQRLAELESSRAALSAAAAGAGGSSEAAVVFSVLRGLLLVSATKVRSMFPCVAEAVEAVQPGAQAAAVAHFAIAEWFAPAPKDSTVPAGTAASTTAAEAAEALLQAEEEMVRAAGSASAAAAAAEAGGGAAASRPRASRRRMPAVVRPSAALEAAPQGALRRLLDRAGLGRSQLLPALHMLVLFAAAGTLTVCKAAFVGLKGKSDWVFFSVNSVFEKSSGRIRYRGINRFLGTLLGAAWSCVVIGLTWLINDGYHDSATKYAVMAVLVSLWGFFVGLNRNRHPRYSYAWTVCMVAVPVVVLEDFKLPVSPWQYAAYRIACVSFGIAMDVLVCSLVFPVTTSTLIKQHLLRAL
ncbi:hypothetical protein ABPG75_010183 [Micractinium tetrahymenae]